MGRNGSGKSTLVRLLSGARLPDTGRVLWGGVDTAEADRAQVFDRVAMVAQDFYRWPFTARVNVGIGRPGTAMDDTAIGAAAGYAGRTRSSRASRAVWTPCSPAATRAGRRSPAASGRRSGSPAPGTATGPS